MTRTAVRCGAAGLAAAVLLGGVSGCATLRSQTTTLMDALSPSPGAPPISATAAAALPDEVIEQRLAMLVERLDAGQFGARLWQYGWLAVNGGGVILAGSQAPSDEGSDRVFDIIEASKGAIGVIYLLLQPMPGRVGSEPVRDMPDATHDDKAARLVRAEELLFAAASRAEQRESWAIHVGNLALNAIGAAVLLGYDDAGLAALSFGLDTVVGELQIWSQPVQPVLDWDDYQFFVSRLSGDAPPPPTSWHIVPNGSGLALQVRF